MTDCSEDKHDWRFSGDIKTCSKCYKSELIDWSKNLKIQFQQKNINNEEIK